MSYRFTFRPTAAKDLRKLPIATQRRIAKKLEFFRDQDDPLQFATRLVGTITGQYRFRVGDYRVVFDVEENEIIILMIEHRREVYRRK